MMAPVADAAVVTAVTAAAVAAAALVVACSRVRSMVCNISAVPIANCAATPAPQSRSIARGTAFCSTTLDSRPHSS